MGVLHSLSTKNIFREKMDLRLFHFHLTIYNKNLIITKIKKMQDHKETCEKTAAPRTFLLLMVLCMSK